MAINDLLKAVRGASSERVWGAAVSLARDRTIVLVARDEDEIQLRVPARGRKQEHEVFLWPKDGDWGCDCELSSNPCIHICAAVIALNARQTETGTVERATPTFHARVAYNFRSEGPSLFLDRTVMWSDGRSEPLVRGTLVQRRITVPRGDTQADALLETHTGGKLPAEIIRRLLVFLEGGSEGTLNGEPITLSPEPIKFLVRVTDEGDGFKVGLYRPSGVDALFRGAVRIGTTLHPTSHGSLSREQRRQLVKGVHYPSDDVGKLVRIDIPRLRQAIPVEVGSDRLPTGNELEPRVTLSLREVPEGLRVLASIVYGDPPIARLSKGVLAPLADRVPARNPGAERTAERRFESLMGMPVGIEQTLPPSRAATFLQEELERFDGTVNGRIDAHRFQVVRGSIIPSIAVRSTDEIDGWQLDVAFDGPRGGADTHAVLQAWSSGRSLVPLLEGGFAPLPKNWLADHGTVLRELLEARDAEGRVDRNATAALVELLEGTQSPVPPDLAGLQTFLASGEGLQEIDEPEGFVGELRSYQKAGIAWLRFLREMNLCGILADDMGLGKTVQTLVALRESGGRSLVVAPTSVLRNWAREATRFFPDMTVNVYHGPARRLDDSDLTVTSYALLRLDLDLLRDQDWMYVVLDEAQAIKNARSQTARSAFAMSGNHRLALTGTPVENRLEELWSQFRFLMPGLLGSAKNFKERFVRPIEAGEDTPRSHLRRRIRPYVLRRMKTQVAPELPPLTDMVLTCEMAPDQRRVYDAVRLAAREDVMAALDDRGVSGATMHILEALLRMRQACCDPGLLPGDVGDGVSSAKLDRLEDLLVEIVCGDHKALLFSQWTSMLNLVEKRLQKLGIDWVRLDGTTRDRQRVVDAFQSEDGPPVFLLSLKAGGTGLNLTAADYVVHLDPWWNPAVQQQATDRAWRIGQDRPVVSCRLVAAGTVEQRILALQDAKRDLAEAALGTEGGFVRSLTGDELRSLFEEATG